MIFEPVLSRQPVRQPWTHERLVRERAIALGHAIDRSTKSSYNSGTNSYLTFCHPSGNTESSIVTSAWYIVAHSSHCNAS